MSTRIPDPGRASGVFDVLQRSHTHGAPFDDILQSRADDTEFWSARDLAAVMHYDQWRNFAAAVDRARVAIGNQGGDPEHHIAGASKMVTIGSGASRAVDDYHLTRFGAYLTVMNGDPRKPEVAAAQAYFAIKTRQAETVPVRALSEDEIVHQALAITARRVEQLTERVAELAPKAEFYDELMEADGTYSMLAVSKMLGWGRNVMMRELRRAGVLQGNNLPYQRYSHHFKVVPGTYVNAKTGETVPTATTYVRPSGVPFLRKKLGGALEHAELAGADS